MHVYTCTVKPHDVVALPKLARGNHLRSMHASLPPTASVCNTCIPITHEYQLITQTVAVHYVAVNHS